MTSIVPQAHLANPLATSDQLLPTSQNDVPSDLGASLHFLGSCLTQAAGVLLRLPQDVVAQAIVLFSRFWCGPEGGSFLHYSIKDVSAACVYMTAKLSAHPQSPRNVLNVYSYLSSPLSPLMRTGEECSTPQEPESYCLSEGNYQAQRSILMKTESRILRVVGFQVHIALPYTLAVNYLQALDVLGSSTGSGLAQRVFAHLTTALLNPQLLYLTHQPPALATAAIYLSAREVGHKLPQDEWWEVFDVDREELGFLVVAMGSMEGFAQSEMVAWGKRSRPMTVEDVEDELNRRKMLNGQG